MHDLVSPTRHFDHEVLALNWRDIRRQRAGHEFDLRRRDFAATRQLLEWQHRVFCKVTHSPGLEFTLCPPVVSRRNGVFLFDRKIYSCPLPWLLQVGPLALTTVARHLALHIAYSHEFGLRHGRYRF